MAMESPVTAWLGPMAPLLQKVRSLKFMVPKHIQGASDDDIKHFKKHVELLCRDLLEPEETSSMPKWWRKEVRELLYDTEDRLDKVILLPGGDFSELIAGVEDACERRKRLKLASNDKTIKPDLGEVHVSSSCLTPDELTSHKLSMPISTSSSCIVGLDELMNKLVKQLAFDDHNQKGFKVVPILGFPGAIHLNSNLMFLFLVFPVCTFVYWMDLQVLERQQQLEPCIRSTEGNSSVQLL